MKIKKEITKQELKDLKELIKVIDPNNQVFAGTVENINNYKKNKIKNNNVGVKL